jgi:hypothetical protein
VTISYDMIYRQDMSAHTRSKKNSNILGIFQLHSKYFYAIAESVIKININFSFRLLMARLRVVNGPLFMQKWPIYYTQTIRIFYKT